MKPFTFTLNKKDICLCGSGKKYKHCCFEYAEYTFDDYKLEIDKSNYKLAYCIINSELTKYLILVKRHTSPMLKQNRKAILPLFMIDIEAVGESLDKIMFFLNKPDVNIDFIAKINSISSILDEKTWKERLQSYLLIYYFSDKEALYREIEKIEIDEVEDIELIKILLDVKGEDLGIGQKLALLDKVIISEKEIVVKAKYIFQKALLYFLNSDEKTALKISKEAIEIIEKSDISSKLYYTIVVMQIYSMYGEILSDTSYLKKAISLCLTIIESDDLSDNGLADIMVKLGHTYFLVQDYENAIKYLTKSKSFNYTYIADIYLIFVRLQLEEYSVAQEMLSKIDYNELNKANMFDYLVAFAVYILKTKDKRQVETIGTLLKNIQHLNVRYFDAVKMNLLIDLQELSFNDTVEDEIVRIKWLDKLNKVVILQPNFFGIGVNINNLIDKYNKK